MPILKHPDRYDRPASTKTLPPLEAPQAPQSTYQLPAAPFRPCFKPHATSLIVQHSSQYGLPKACQSLGPPLVVADFVAPCFSRLPRKDKLLTILAYGASKHKIFNSSVPR